MSQAVLLTDHTIELHEPTVSNCFINILQFITHCTPKLHKHTTGKLELLHKFMLHIASYPVKWEQCQTTQLATWSHGVSVRQHSYLVTWGQCQTTQLATW